MGMSTGSKHEWHSQSRVHHKALYYNINSYFKLQCTVIFVEINKIYPYHNLLSSILLQSNRLSRIQSWRIHPQNILLQSSLLSGTFGRSTWVVVVAVQWQNRMRIQRNWVQWWCNGCCSLVDIPPLDIQELKEITVVWISVELFRSHYKTRFLYRHC